MTGKEKNRPGMTSPGTMLLPREEMLELRQREKKIVVGIPSDFHKVEFRVPLTPQAVDLLVSHGHEIWMEAGAGKQASYSDREYAEAGARIAEKREEVMQCDLILR
ncbi:MAG: hypothetical protein KA780_09710, partial [Prolixibacteraceae bacterium]|nr:hypothetical protein [Prolixibacteraceae bacterium]